MTRPPTYSRRDATDAGFAEAVQVMFTAVAVLAFVMLLTFAGRAAEARVRVDHAAESAAQAAALQRTPQAATKAATITANAGLTACVGAPQVEVDTAGWQPGGVVEVTITCAVRSSDLAPLPLPGTLTVSQRSAAVIDAHRSTP